MIYEIFVVEDKNDLVNVFLEQFKGVLPIWLSPVQVNIIPINMKYHDEYCRKIQQLLEDENIRVEYDISKEQLGKKIRQSNIMKNPLTLILGDNERDNNLISFRKLGSEETKTMSIAEFLEFIKIEINKR